MLALTTATFAVGRGLENKPIQVLGCVLTCLLIVAWATIFITMIRAVYVKDILWPQKQEDRDEGGWQSTYSTPESIETKSPNSVRRRKASSPETERHTVVVDAERTEEADWTDTAREESPEEEIRVGVEGLINQRIRGRPPTQSEDMV